MLTWRKRQDYTCTDIASYRIRRTIDGRYRVVRHHCLLPGGFADEWVAMRRVSCAINGIRWDILSRHKSEERARQACEGHAKQHGGAR